MKKKLTALFLALVMCMTMSAPVFASEKKDDTLAELTPTLTAEAVCTNEYDYIVGVRSASSKELKALDISEEKLSYINSNAIEAELLYRATLSDEVLRNHYCYTDEAIQILRAYDGSPLEENAQMRSVTATLTATLSPIVNTTTRTGLLYTWSWSAMPLNDLTDIVAITWSGTYRGGGSNNMTLNEDDSFANIQYFATSDEQRGVTLGVDSGQLDYGGYVEVPLGRYFNGVYHWAKSGGLYMYADLANPEDGPELYRLSVHGEYAHYAIGVGFGVSFLGDLSISFEGPHFIHGSKNLRVTP